MSGRLVEVFETHNSTYEVDITNGRVRRVNGFHAPTPAFSPEGEWKPVESVRITATGLYFWWPDGTCTRTSQVTMTHFYSVDDAGNVAVSDGQDHLY